MPAKKPAPRSATLNFRSLRSTCPVSSSLDLMGDKWTLLILRDLMMKGPRRYGDFQASPEGIPSNLLAERLKRLEAAGLIARRPYKAQPPRYEYSLLPAGEALRAVMLGLRDWGLKHLAGTEVPGRPLGRGLPEK